MRRPKLLTMLESEKDLDKKLVNEVKKLGGWCIKFVCLHITGLPDRICLMPGGFIFFAEIKTTGEKPKLIQLVVHEKLRKLGFEVIVIDNSETLKNALLKYDKNA